MTPAAAGAQLQADAEMLTVAVVNLIDNAVKFSGDAADPVTLSCVVEGGRGVISVADRGIGIPAAEIDAVKNPSYRGSNAVAVEGTGLGLSLVQRIVDAHGGELVLVSTERVGTVASIRLPLAQAKADA